MKISVSRGVGRLVVLGVVGLISIGVVGDLYGADDEAVKRRLKKAVKKGELTEKEADVMLGALKKMGEKDKAMENEAIARRLKTAVNRGDLSEKEAWAMWEALTKRANAKKQYERIDADLEWIGSVLKKLVNEGRLSEEQANARWERIEKGFAVRKRLEGRKKRESDDERNARLTAIWKKLQMMVMEGKLSEKEAHAKMAAIKKKAAVRYGDWGKKTGHHKSEAIGFKKELGEAMKAGKITREEAAAKWAWYLKKHQAVPRKKSDKDLEAIWRKLLRMVKEGKISEKEAHAKMAEIKKRRLNGKK